MRIEFSELGRHEAWLRLSSIVKASDDKQIRLERKLTSELIKNWRETYEEALKTIFLGAPEALLTQPIANRALDVLSNALGENFGNSQKVREQFEKYIKSAYEGGKSEFAVNPELSLPDRKAIDVLTKHNCYWLGEHYGKHIGPRIAEMTQHALEDGLGRKELARELRSALGGEVGGYKYWDVVSSAALVRSRSFGCISGMVDAGIVEYEILAMEDERMCPICGEMHGQTFSVAATQKVIEQTLEITDPEKFKEAMPWQTEPAIGMAKDKLIAEGMGIQPFHGRCRCVLIEADIAGGFVGALGALNDSNDPNEERRDAHAKRHYEELRNRRDREAIISKLSTHSGISMKSARKVFEHIFINEYELDDGARKRFDPSYDMAESIRRLLHGKNIQEHDIILVHHERLEYELMNRYGKDSRTAHSLTCRKYDYQDVHF